MPQTGAAGVREPLTGSDPNVGGHEISSPNVPAALTGVLLAPDSATVLCQDGGAIGTSRVGPALNVRFRCYSECFQYVSGKLRDNRYTSRGDALMIGKQKISCGLPLCKLGVAARSNKRVSLRLRQSVETSFGLP